MAKIPQTDLKTFYATLGDNFINILRAALLEKIQKAQKDLQLDCLFCTFGICMCKSCLWNIDEIDPWSRCFMIEEDLTFAANGHVTNARNSRLCHHCECETFWNIIGPVRFPNHYSSIEQWSVLITSTFSLLTLNLPQFFPLQSFNPFLLLY